jgi:hypothetical protein
LALKKQESERDIYERKTFAYIEDPKVTQPEKQANGQVL